MAELHGTATVTLSELTTTDLDGFLDLLSERAFRNDSSGRSGWTTTSSLTPPTV